MRDITCPKCGKQIKIPEQLIGRPVACPACKHRFMVHASIPVPPPPAAGTTPPFPAFDHEPAQQCNDAAALPNDKPTMPTPEPNSTSVPKRGVEKLLGHLVEQDANNTPGANSTSGANNTSFGTALETYSICCVLAAVCAFFGAVFVALYFASIKQSGLTIFTTVAVGIGSGLSLLVVADLCLAVVHLVRNSFKACEILERIESQSLKNPS